MSEKVRRVVLAFYSGDEAYAEQAFQSLRTTPVKIHYYRGGQEPDSSWQADQKYAALRLPDEGLLIVEADPSLVTRVVKILRNAGEPAIFFARSQSESAHPHKSDAAAVCNWRNVLERLDEYEAELKATRGDLIEATRLDHTVTESGKWVLDNTHLLRTNIAEVRRALPKRFRRVLSRFTSADGGLQVCELARSIVSAANNAVAEEGIIDSVTRYQVSTPLSIAELWAFPIMLRFALIEALAGLAVRVSQEQQIRESAYLWANRLAAAGRSGPESVARTLALLEAQSVAVQPYFATCLAEQLQDEETALVPTQQWIESRLGTPVSELVRPEHNREAAECLSIANGFNSLRVLSHIDFSEIFESLNVVEQELRRDPSGTYPRCDFRTRDRCRHTVESVACRSGLPELEVARKVVAAASEAEIPEQREVCWHLLSAGIGRLEKDLHASVSFRARLVRFIRDRATFFYLAGVICVAFCLLAIAASLALTMGVRQPVTFAILSVLSLFPLSELAVQIVNAFIISTFEPDTLPKLDFDDGIPLDQATLVVVPMMLSNLDVVRQEIEKLEVRFLANQDPSLFFALFSDYSDAKEAVMPGDAELLEAITSGIAGLNKLYAGNRFLLFHRDRVWSESEGRWIGRERKRGKIEELNQFLRGKHAGHVKRLGELPLPIRYVITLDADTQLPPGSARRMVATIAHPLNRPVLDPVTKVRRRGFTIIQPRVSIGLPGATASRFTRVFADTSGTDPYCQTVSDAQQDLFGEAIFHGKAIYDVEAFDASIGHRFPAETLLSHDLIEGSYAGVALASDIELYENMPLDYASFCKRTHRWIRGDWQIASWVMGSVPVADLTREPNPLSAISRWRILDNLRRSLVPLASMLLLLAGWIVSTAPGAWSLIVGLAIAIPAVAPVLERLVHRIQGTIIGWQGAHDELLRAAVMIAFLPHQAWISADAIAKVLYRRFISRRNLLEWQTAERTDAESRRHISSTMRQMAIVSGCSVILMLLLLAEHAFAPVSLFVCLWIGSPALLHWLNSTASTQLNRNLLQANGRMLRGYARQTWRFFDDLVGPDTNWLPPDNSQVALRVEIAHRTSPTNIGLWLCSALAARDFGYVTPDDLLVRCTKTLGTLSRLQRYEGHLLNWYNTNTAEPLFPRYVSTVDSGNLLASLWVLAQGAHDIVRAPILSRTCIRGLSDTLAQLESATGDDPSMVVPLQTMRKLLRGKGDGLHIIGRLRMATVPAEQLVAACKQNAAGDEGSYWAGRLAAEVLSWNNTIDSYLKWVETLTQLPDFLLNELGEGVVQVRRRVLSATWSLESLAAGGPASMRQLLSARNTRGVQSRVENWLAAVERDFQEAQRNASHALRGWQTLAQRSVEFADAMNMGFLYDEKRKLFGIGYLVGGPVHFSSHYDLLASECRVASLVAIAKGDVPLEHWFALGRPRVSRPEGQTLLSWTGTMFEYLMPLLFTRNFDNSLLDSACRNAVTEQIEWGRDRSLPWGVSECAWSALDSNQTYQYHAFGIPALALKPGLDEQNVVAPYATMLSLPLDPEAAIQNLSRLQKLGLEGPMGFYESVDFTRESTSEGGRGVVVYTYMSHHQGMSLLALDNLLHRGTMQRRFHADRRIRAIESLLFERVPTSSLPSEDFRTGLTAPVPVTATEPADRVWRENTAVPRVHLYGNGRYSLMVTNSGGGYSRWKAFDLTRWRSDPASDSWGSFIYVRDLKSRATWSTSWHPIGSAMGTSTVRFLADHTEFHRRALDIETVQAITVAAEDDAELRRVTITNWSTRMRELEFTSYVELALAPHAADTAHPAFAKMFIETEYAGNGLLIAQRRLRSPEETPVWSAHLLMGAPDTIQYETDRATFLGRGNTPATPEALRRDLNSSTGTVIDPIFSLRCRVVLAPRDRIELSFITLAASSRQELLALAARYRYPGAVTQAMELVWTRSQLQFRYLGIGTEQAHRFQELASYMLYPNPRLRPPDRVARNRSGQSGLWIFGISGDLPILSVTIADERYLNLVRELLQAHTYWRMRGMRADLVILNQESPSYDAPLRQQLQRLIEAHSMETGIDVSGGVFLRDWNPLPEDQRNLLLAVSCVVLGGNRGSLQQQLAGISEASASGAKLSGDGSAEEPSLPLPFLELPYFNGQGGFTKDGREYAIYLKPGDTTPAPWVNVMANAGFGGMVSESGLGFTWRGNSQMNRLTPWNNDPVSDEPSEVVYMRDEESGVFWSPTPQPIRESDAYRARHGQGYTVFEHNSHGIGQELTVFVPVDQSGSGEPVKIFRLRLRNDSSRARQLSVTYFASLVLGGVREVSQLHIQTSRDEQSGALFARQYWSGSYTGHVTFAASTPAPSSWSGDRTQFLGRNRSVSRPAAMERVQLENRVGVALDPAMALQVKVSLDRGQQTDVIFLLGQTETPEECRSLLSRCRAPEQVESLLAGTRRWWDSVLGVLQVKSPLLSTDMLLNRWLLYQSLSCRFWGRSAFYQSSGAMGFRDQLQDSLAFVYAAPQLTRAHILLAASRQFVEGDVQHWWHAETGMGVRTKCSDDLVWLPYVVARYAEITGDRGILSESVPFLEAPELTADEHERLSTPSVSAESATLWEHCRRALDRAYRLGAHELPLIGNGDWNDGMNHVGPQGRGESVWLAWFLAATLHSFADLSEATEQAGPAAAWRERAALLSGAVERSAWDGDWYLRAYFDDGSPLGSHANAEARIDSLPQSWAVISGLGDVTRSAHAMDSAQSLLVDSKDHLVRLFTPPFDRSEPHPGYIMGYPPGLRENGGQYTHGSLWMAMAWARLGDGGKAGALLTMMSPAERTRNPEAVARYCGEPYAVAADVSAAPGRVGRAGWTCYTGSAAWMYRIWIEEVLGFTLRGDSLTLKPVIPDDWPGFEIQYRYRTATYDIVVERGAGAAAVSIRLDGRPATENTITLSDDGKVHQVLVRIQAAQFRGGEPAESELALELH
jgi:cyclic beta-1,2-glucan synthetase